MHRLQPSKPCTACGLGQAYRARPIQVFGQSMCAADEVRLIVISAYPGGNEKATNLSLSPDPPRTAQQEAMLVRGAGGYLRQVMCALFRQSLPDIEHYTYFTNVVKCMPPRTPGGPMPVSDRHVKTCNEYWLQRELASLPPTTPILLAASQGITALLPDLEGGIAANRRQVHYWQQHPVVLTMNPIEAERGHIKHVVASSTVNGITNATALKYGEVLLGSRPWHFVQDLKLVRDLVLATHETK